MPHDRNGNLLAVGDPVILPGVIKAITSEQPTYCNVAFVPDVGMAPGEDAAEYALSARMVEKVFQRIAQTPSSPPAVMTSEPLLPVAESKAFRRDLDAILQPLKNSARKSRERSIAVTKLQEAIMWLGMDLKAIDEASPGAAPNPYPQSYDPTSPVVEKTADGLKL